MALTIALAGCTGALEPGQDPGRDAAPQESNKGNNTKEVVAEGWFGFGMGSGDDMNINGRAQGPAQVEFGVPANFTAGTLELEWSEQGIGDLQLAFWRDGQSTSDPAHHVFYLTSAPFIVELEPNDERVRGVTTVLMLPGGEGPGAFVRVDWHLQGTFEVPAGESDA